MADPTQEQEEDEEEESTGGLPTIGPFPWDLELRFKADMKAFIAASDGRFYLYSGFRSTETQTQLKANDPSSRTAPPGKSNHQRGTAADLIFRGDGNRNGKEYKEAVKWAHDNAARFNLNFNLKDRKVNPEDWHVVPLNYNKNTYFDSVEQERLDIPGYDQPMTPEGGQRKYGGPGHNQTTRTPAEVTQARTKLAAENPAYIDPAAANAPEETKDPTTTTTTPTTTTTLDPDNRSARRARLLSEARTPYGAIPGPVSVHPIEPTTTTTRKPPTTTTTGAPSTTTTTTSSSRPPPTTTRRSPLAGLSQAPTAADSSVPPTGTIAPTTTTTRPENENEEEEEDGNWWDWFTWEVRSSREWEDIRERAIRDREITVPETATAQEREAAGEEIAENVDAEGLIDGVPLSEEEETLAELFAASEAGKALLDRATLEQYGLFSADVPNFLADLADQARQVGLGDLSTADLVDRLLLGDPDIAVLAAQLARGNTFDRVFIKTGGQDFGMAGIEYRSALAVSGVDAETLSLTVAAADDHGFADAGGWQNLLLLVKQAGVLLIEDAAIVDRSRGHHRGGDIPANARSILVERGVDRVAAEYEQYLTRFNGVHSLAMIAVAGREDLAREAYMNGGLSPAGQADVNDLLDGWDRFQDLRQLGINKTDKFWTQLTTGPGAGVGAGGGLSTLPNSEDTKESYRTIYRAMFLEDPTERDIADFAATVMSEYMEEDAKSREGFNVFKGGVAKDRELQQVLREPAAMARDRIRSNPLYDELYGKRGNLTEEQYRSGFQNTLNDLGADVNTQSDTIRAGLRTGEKETVRSRYALSEGGQESDTLQKRLADAAQLLARYT